MESAPKVRFATDSALEGTGFEPSVPPSSFGRSGVPHRCPNGSGGEGQLATQQETSPAFRCMSYADQDQADGLQARAGEETWCWRTVERAADELEKDKLLRRRKIGFP